MTPLHALAWIGVAAVALLVAALVVEAFRPTRRLVRGSVVDGNGVVVSTVTHVVGEAPAEARLPDGRRFVVETPQK